jgi:hypothetical protein
MLSIQTVVSQGNTEYDWDQKSPQNYYVCVNTNKTFASKQIAINPNEEEYPSTGTNKKIL